MTDGSGAALASGQPAAWAAALPRQVFLPYIMTNDSYGGALKLQSGAFRAAMKHAGRPVDLYAPTAHFDDRRQWMAALYESMSGSMTK